jgi:hypothetical protein
MLSDKVLPAIGLAMDRKFFGFITDIPREATLSTNHPGKATTGLTLTASPTALRNHLDRHSACRLA